MQSVACGGSYTFGLTRDGKLYSFGWGKDGQLGLGWHTDRSNPRVLGSEINGQVAHIACCGSHVVACTSEGKAYSWGNADKGKLGQAENGNASSPVLIDSLQESGIPAESQPESCILPTLHSAHCSLLTCLKLMHQLYTEATHDGDQSCVNEPDPTHCRVSLRSRQTVLGVFQTAIPSSWCALWTGALPCPPRARLRCKEVPLPAVGLASMGSYVLLRYTSMLLD